MSFNVFIKYFQGVLSIFLIIFLLVSCGGSSGGGAEVEGLHAEVEISRVNRPGCPVCRLTCGCPAAGYVCHCTAACGGYEGAGGAAVWAYAGCGWAIAAGADCG